MYIYEPLSSIVNPSNPKNENPNLWSCMATILGRNKWRVISVGWCFHCNPTSCFSSE